MVAPGAAEVTTRILIADDHPLFRDALRHAVAGVGGGIDIGEAGGLDNATLELDRAPDTDLVLLDLAMPGVRGFSGLVSLRARYPQVPVIVISANDSREVIQRCIELGASGFIPKTIDAEAIRAAIRTVLEGGVWTPPGFEPLAEAHDEVREAARRLASLTPQQARVLGMLSEGMLNKQIAYELSLSEATVKAHVSAILQKFGVDSRTQAVIVASKINGEDWPGATAAK
jgi:DNA-binding NarL/FixJ family response regulator